MNDAKKIAKELARNPKVRKEVAKKSFYYFIVTYFMMYLKFAFADFHKEMIKLAEDERSQTLVITGFRGCGKSSIMTVFYPIWCILGIHKKKYILIICKTIEQAKQTGKNIKIELESNKVLKQDLGPFEESKDWSSVSFVFTKQKARIRVASIEQSIRGTRHGYTRPEVIICDDIEDIASTRTQEGRNTTYETLTREIIPAGDTDTRLIIIGNNLHEDSLINRFKQQIDRRESQGKWREYPIIKNGKPLWPSKFPNKQAVEREKKRIGNSIVWLTEYLLKIVSDKDAVCKREWILSYKQLPTC